MESVPVNFFLTKKDIEENVVSNMKSGSQGQDMSTVYIIYQNNHLVTRINEVTLENTKLKQEKDEQEEFCDKLEKTRTCLQGYVKNEYERANKYKQLSTIYSHNLNLQENRNLLTHALTAIDMTIVVLLHFLIKNTTLIATILVCYTGYTLIMLGRLYRATKTNKSREVIALLDDIKKTEQSNVYIDELIDNM